jgi:hypothetical protein
MPYGISEILKNEKKSLLEIWFTITSHMFHSFVSLKDELDSWHNSWSCYYHYVARSFIALQDCPCFNSSNFQEHHQI